jgi:sigma-B regulation protein RsbU (phosphoserine phosphatase)
MITVGTMDVGQKESVVATRKKIRNIVRLLTDDLITATQLATATSELSRLLCSQSPDSHIVVSVDLANSNPILALTFEGPTRLQDNGPMMQFFDDATASGPENGQHSLQTVKYLRKALPHDEHTIDQLREIVEQKSTDELMVEVQEKNTELEKYKDHLEQTVQERTAQLEDALKTISDQKERMEGELNIGREIQMSMIPLVANFPNYEEFDISALLKPAREVGGDFYDFFFVDEDRICLCIGDVSGKGVPAALFMAMTKTLIKSRAADDKSPASILTHVNDELSRENPSSMFVTIFAGILNIRTGEFYFTNAGHNPPYIKENNGALLKLGSRHGPVLGAISGIAYGEESLQMTPGSILFIYTDGVTEAMDPDGNLFSEKRLEDVLESKLEQTAESSLNSVTAKVSEFQSDAEQADDITILSVQFVGRPHTTAIEDLVFTIENDVSEIPKAYEKITEFLEGYDIDVKILYKIQVVLDEMLNNIISYGYDEKEEGIIEIKVEYTGKRLSLTIADDGKPFNPLTAEAPDTSLSLEEREIGGLGIHIVRNMVDDAIYERKIDKNVLRLVYLMGEKDD